jgi:tetratricopeptide (TPR) repeat protein
MRLATATLVPVAAFALLEVGLRITGFGYPTPFFLPSTIDGRDYLVPNEEFSYRFFPPALARTPDMFRMAATKPEGTCRVFLFGESAAFGDPDPSYGVGRYLEALLAERYPSTTLEVICVSMTAINSHAILPIARECARYDGDLWVIYMGHNEMVGPYGAGTIFGKQAPRLGRVRGILAIKTTRVGQLLDGLLTWVRGDSSIPASWGGINMFSKNQLRYDDPGRLRAYENFRGNLADILDAGREAGVPILLSTVASNLKDCAPFASLHAPGLDAKQRADWDMAYRAGLALEDAASFPAALDAYANAAAIDAEFAELHFRMGTCHLALGRTREARTAFELARDRDALGFRADTRINQALLSGDDDVVRVDAAAALAEQSADGIPGQDDFYEHVHFTLAGNYRLARILADAAVDLLPATLREQGGGAWAGADDCNRRLAVTTWDQQRLWRDILQRTSVAPFTSQSSHPRNTAHRELQLRSVLARIQPDTPRKDRRLYANALARAPDDNILHANYAQFLETTTSRSQAITEGRRVCELLPDLSWPHYYLGALLVREGRLQEAADCFERALEIRSGFLQARNALGQIRARHPGR